MPIPAFTQAWADALMQVVNADHTYAADGKGWTNPVALVAEPCADLAAGVAVQLDLRAGTCLSAASMPPADVNAPYVLSADLATWIQVVREKMDPLLMVARGKVKLTKGSLGTLMMNAKGAKALVACAQEIDTLWPGD
jgi:putative sterol carrier protein